MLSLVYLLLTWFLVSVWVLCLNFAIAIRYEWRLSDVLFIISTFLHFAVF